MTWRVSNKEQQTTAGKKQIAKGETFSGPLRTTPCHSVSENQAKGAFLIQMGKVSWSRVLYKK